MASDILQAQSRLRQFQFCFRTVDKNTGVKANERGPATAIFKSSNTSCRARAAASVNGNDGGQRVAPRQTGCEKVLARA